MKNIFTHHLSKFPVVWLFTQSVSSEWICQLMSQSDSQSVSGQTYHNVHSFIPAILTVAEILNKTYWTRSFCSCIFCTQKDQIPVLWPIQVGTLVGNAAAPTIFFYSLKSLYCFLEKSEENCLGTPESYSCSRLFVIKYWRHIEMAGNNTFSLLKTCRTFGPAVGWKLSDRHEICWTMSVGQRIWERRGDDELRISLFLFWEQVFLFFEQNWGLCSHKLCSYKKKRVHPLSTPGYSVGGDLLWYVWLWNMLGHSETTKTKI